MSGFGNAVVDDFEASLPAFAGGSAAPAAPIVIESAERRASASRPR